MTNLTTAQVAQHLSISGSRVRALIKAGRLPAEKVGRDWVIRQADLDAYVPRKAGRPSTPPQPGASVRAESDRMMKPIVTTTSTSIVIQYWTGDMSGYAEWQISKRADICTDEIGPATFASHGQQHTANTAYEYAEQLRHAAFIALRLDCCILELSDFEKIETLSEENRGEEWRIFRHDDRVIVFFSPNC